MVARESAPAPPPICSTPAVPSSRPPTGTARGSRTLKNASPLYDELVLSFTLRRDDEYKFAGEMCGLFNYMADGHSRAPEKGSRGNSVFRAKHVIHEERESFLGSSWFTDENMEELATYAADSYLYQAWERATSRHISAEVGSTSNEAAGLYGLANTGSRLQWFSDADYSDGYYDSEDDDGEYDSEDDDGEYDSEDDDGEYDGEYSEEPSTRVSSKTRLMYDLPVDYVFRFVKHRAKH